MLTTRRWRSGQGRLAVRSAAGTGTMCAGIPSRPCTVYVWCEDPLTFACAGGHVAGGRHWLVHHGATQPLRPLEPDGFAAAHRLRRLHAHQHLARGQDRNPSAPAFRYLNNIRIEQILGNVEVTAINQDPLGIRESGNPSHLATWSSDGRLLCQQRASRSRASGSPRAGHRRRAAGTRR